MRNLLIASSNISQSAEFIDRVLKHIAKCGIYCAEFIDRTRNPHFSSAVSYLREGPFGSINKPADKQIQVADYFNEKNLKMKSDGTPQPKYMDTRNTGKTFLKNKGPKSNIASIRYLNLTKVKKLFAIQ